MALDALLFDLDGTLVDTNAAHVESWLRALRHHGYTFSADRIRPEIGKGGDNLVPAILGHEADARDGDALRSRVAKEFTELARRTRFALLPGARELLAAARARGLKTALATSSKDEQLDTIFGSVGTDLRADVDAVVTASDVARSKPAGDVVQAAVTKLGLSPGQCALVGDTPHDAESARRAGVTTLALLSGGTTPAEAFWGAGARGVWRDPADLLAHLDDAMHAASPASVSLTAELMESWMREALGVGKEGGSSGGIPIGCVVAGGDGTLLARASDGRGASRRGLAHAVVTALGACSDAGALGNGAIVISTVEPCLMCMGASVESGVDTVVFGYRAPRRGATSRVLPLATPLDVMPRVIGGVLAAEGRHLLDTWLARRRGTASLVS